MAASPAFSISASTSCISCWKSWRARDEVGFAVHLDEDARTSDRRDAVADQPFARRAAGLLRRARQAALAQDGVRLVEVAVGLGQRVLAFHHARAGLVAELLHICCGDRRRHDSLLRLFYVRKEGAGLGEPGASAKSPEPLALSPEPYCSLGRGRRRFARGAAGRAARAAAVVARHPRPPRAHASASTDCFMSRPGDRRRRQCARRTAGSRAARRRCPG